MANKTCLINQPAGLGDIFFCQKIADILLYNGYEVVWPVKSSISWVGDYLTNSDRVQYVIEDSYTPNGDEVVITLDGAQNITGQLIMPSKYQILDIPWSDWSQYFSYNRNYEKEQALFYDVLGLVDGEEYTFANKHYGTPPNSKVYNIETFPNEKVVELKFLEYFTIFDWSMVLEKASRIVTIDTCILFMIEILQTQAQDLTCYCRQGNFTYKQISPLFNKPWKYKWN